MLYFTSIAALALALTPQVLAEDFDIPRTIKRRDVPLETASNGALDPLANRPAILTPEIEAAVVSTLTIVVTNSHGTALSVFYGSNAGSPTPIGNPGSGTLGVAAATTVRFPQGWAGRMTLGKTFDPAGSKIEANLVAPYVPDVDVSYVDG